MKNVTIFALALFVLTGVMETAKAQQLPSTGDRTFEITVSPFSATPVSFTQLRLRQFQSADQALRLRGGLNYNSERLNEDDRDSRFSLTVAPGMEWHTLQHERLSVYYGLEVPITYVTSRQHRDEFTNKNTDGNEHVGIGVNGLAGLDFHFMERLYIGVEVLYGVRYRSFLDREIGDVEFSNDTNDVTFGMSSISRFRLGFTF